MENVELGVSNGLKGDVGRNEVAVNIQEHLKYQERHLSFQAQQDERRELTAFLQESGQLPALSIDWAVENFSTIDDNQDGAITGVELLKHAKEGSYDQMMTKGLLLNYQAIKEATNGDCETGLTKDDLKSFLANVGQDRKVDQVLQSGEIRSESLPLGLIEAATQRVGEGAYAAAQRLLPNGTLAEIKALTITLNEEYARATGDTSFDRRNMTVGYQFINEENAARIFARSKALQATYPDSCWNRF